MIDVITTDGHIYHFGPGRFWYAFASEDLIVQPDHGEKKTFPKSEYDGLIFCTDSY